MDLSFFTSPTWIITFICFAGFAFCQIVYVVIKKKHANDPTYAEEQKLREEAYKRRVEKENSDLAEQYGLKSDEYSDIDESEEYEEPSDEE